MKLLLNFVVGGILHISIITGVRPTAEIRPSSLALMREDDVSMFNNLEFEISDYLLRNEISEYELYPGAEMIDYDFTAERQINYATNLIESTAHLIKGCLGAGVLGMHEAFMNGGLWTSLAVTVVIGFIVSYCMLQRYHLIISLFITIIKIIFKMLVGSAQCMYVRLRVPRLTYPDLAEVALATGPFKFCRKLSKAFRYTVDIFIFLDFIGTCCIFEIMIAHTLEKVLKSVTSWELTTSQYISIITFPLITVCLIRSLKILAPFSIIADLFIGSCVIITMYYSITIASSLSDRRSWNNVHGFFRLLGICIYSINGIGVTLPIENNMKKPQYFQIVVQCAMPIVTSYVAIIGFFGYWAWGDKCQTPFTNHMPVNTTSLVLESILAVTLGVTFAVHFWVLFRMIWRYIGSRYKTRRGIWERTYRGVSVFLISCLSLALPNLMTWISFIGNFLMAFLLLIFPALIEILVKWKEPRRCKFRLTLIKNLSLITTGIILCGGALFLLINDYN